MRKYFTVDRVIIFILGGLSWSFLYIIMHVVAVAKAYAFGYIVLQ